MGTSFPTGGFGGSNPVEGMWQAMDQLRSKFEKRVGTRMGRGDVRQAVLALLAEQPMHGYQIIHEIEERSGGSWKPSAGSVYPTLQLLAEDAPDRAAKARVEGIAHRVDGPCARREADQGARADQGHPQGKLHPTILVSAVYVSSLGVTARTPQSLPIGATGLYR